MKVKLSIERHYQLGCSHLLSQIGYELNVCVVVKCCGSVVHLDTIANQLATRCERISFVLGGTLYVKYYYRNGLLLNSFF
jgi:hypothetical protein